MCNLLSIPFSVGFCKMNCAVLSKTLASSVSFNGGLGRPKHCAIVSRLLCTPCRFQFQPRPSVALLERDVHFGEVNIPEFPAQRKSDQFVLVVTVPLQTRLSSSTISYSASEQTEELTEVARWSSRRTPDFSLREFRTRRRASVISGKARYSLPMTSPGLRLI